MCPRGGGSHPRMQDFRFRAGGPGKHSSRPAAQPPWSLSPWTTLGGIAQLVCGLDVGLTWAQRGLDADSTWTWALKARRAGRRAGLRSLEEHVAESTWCSRGIARRRDAWRRGGFALAQEQEPGLTVVGISWRELHCLVCGWFISTDYF